MGRISQFHRRLLRFVHFLLVLLAEYYSCGRRELQLERGAFRSCFYRVFNYVRDPGEKGIQWTCCDYQGGEIGISGLNVTWIGSGW